MEPNESHHQPQQHLSSPYYYHHHRPTTASTAGAVASSAATVPSNNGLFPPPPSNDGSSLVVFPHSVPSSAVTVPMEPTKRKRGRPRKYGTPEQALAAKKMASSASSSSARARREAGGAVSSYSASSRKSQLGSLGKTGQSFTPHIVNIAPGEDVAQKVVLFAQQSKHELCVLSASGTISNASLHQPATSGGIVSYEGQYEIVSLCGSFVRAELGSKTGGLSVCLSGSDGRIIGGGVGGHLKAAGPVQVILGTFQLDRKKETSSGVKGDASSSGNRLPSPTGNATMLGIGFQSGGMESSGRHAMRGNDDHHHQATMSGGHFMMQAPHGMHMTHSRPSEWGNSSHDGRSSAGYDLSGLFDPPVDLAL